MVNQAEIHIELDGEQSISEVEEISMEIQDVINSKFPSIERISVIPHSYSKVNTPTPPTTTSRSNLLRNIKLKKPLKYSNILNSYSKVNTPTPPTTTSKSNLLRNIKLKKPLRYSNKNNQEF